MAKMMKLIPKGMSSSQLCRLSPLPQSGRSVQPLSAWFWTMWLICIVPCAMSTGMMDMPIESSYAIICELLRMPPRKGYFEFDAQPAMTIA